MIGASSGILTNSGASLILGAFGGIFACLGITYADKKFQRWFGLYDTLGVHHVHGVPGMVGAGISAITLGVYQLDPINDST
jgi:ammonium transporter Rh